MDFIKITEQDSLYDKLETKGVGELISAIHTEDQKVTKAIKKVLPAIETLIEKVVDQLSHEGRLFYIGAGTSGRLGVLDASECPPTFGTDPEKVIGLIAGGEKAVYKAVENAEDSTTQGWKDLETYAVSSQDMVIGIAASGTTPYVVHALEACQKNNIPTGCICCNEGSPMAKVSNYPIEVIVGPEFVTGSSRMKAGSAQKMILNMITTASMIRLGHVKGNKMVDMQLNNAKLKKRAVHIVAEKLTVSLEMAEQLLQTHKSIRQAIKNHQPNG